VVGLPAVRPRKTPNVSPDKKEGGPGDWTRALREAAPYLGIGTTLAATVLLGLGAGYWVDGRLGTEPVFFLLGGALGLVAAGYHFARTVIRKP
jgi:F0F1-type ATP synthase assembly protein I